MPEKIPEVHRLRLENIRLRRATISLQLKVLDAENKALEDESNALAAELTQTYKLGGQDRITADGAIVREPPSDE